MSTSPLNQLKQLVGDTAGEVFSEALIKAFEQGVQSARQFPKVEIYRWVCPACEGGGRWESGERCLHCHGNGWGDGLRQHDLLVILHSEGGSCFYEIEQIEYCRDPDDMWFSHCRFVPGSSPLGQKAAAALDGKREPLELWWVFSG